MLDFLGSLQRTHMCGELRAEQDGQPVVLMGWVNRRRDHGNLIFLDVRDRTGITQVVLDKEVSNEAHAKAEAARSEYVVAVKGKVRRRGTGLDNPNMPTGQIEVVASELLLLNEMFFKACHDDLACRYQSVEELQHDLMRLYDQLYGGVPDARL